MLEDHPLEQFAHGLLLCIGELADRFELKRQSLSFLL